MPGDTTPGARLVLLYMACRGVYMACLRPKLARLIVPTLGCDLHRKAAGSPGNLYACYGMLSLLCTLLC